MNEGRAPRRAGFSRSTSAAASCARDFGFGFFWPGFFLALAFFGAAFFAARFFAFLICLTFSATDLFDCHTASPSAAAIFSIVRPLTTDFGFSSRMSGSLRAARGLVLGLDQQPVVALLAAPPVHPHQMPAAGQLLAVEREFEMALRQPLVRIEFGLHVPRSQISTVPPPYWSFGMVPSNALYSTG